ncbi:hypothetical protein LZ30DRAFT_701585 [Colletotrichum cereale]|nr:hypothetical protein LZ30DRAFT_701585 [Colletotrichum cereale]
MPTYPRSNNGFEVAIVGALPREYDAVSLIIDQFWDEDGDRHGRAAGDDNRYTTERVGLIDVVVVLVPNMGKVGAAAAADLQLSYTRLGLVLLTGICGGAPKMAENGEVLLGDVIINKSIMQHDIGSQYADRFATKHTVDDVLGRTTRNIQNITVRRRKGPGPNAGGAPGGDQRRRRVGLTQDR